MTTIFSIAIAKLSLVADDLEKLEASLSAGKEKTYSVGDWIPNLTRNASPYVHSAASHPTRLNGS
jgi:hypothetical protein